MVLAVVVMGFIALVAGCLAVLALQEAEALQSQIDDLKRVTNALGTDSNNLMTEHRRLSDRVSSVSRRKPVRVTITNPGGTTMRDITSAIKTEARLNGEYR